MEARVEHVYLVICKDTLIIHGCFAKKQRAENYIGLHNKKFDIKKTKIFY